MNKCFLLLLFFFLNTYVCQVFAADDKTVDLNKFWEIINNDNEDEFTNNEITQLNNIMRMYPNEIIKNQEKLESISKKLTPSKQSIIYELLSISLYNLGYIEESFIYNENLLKHFRTYSYDLKDSLRAFANKMIIFYSKNQNKEALNSAIKLHERINDFSINKSTIKLYRQVAILYSLLGFEEESGEVIKTAINDAQNKNIKSEINSLKTILGYHYLKSGSIDQAEEIFKELLIILETKNNPLKRWIYAGLASIYTKKLEFDKSIKNYKLAFNEYLKFPDVISIASLIGELANFLGQNETTEGKELLTEAKNFLNSFDYVKSARFKKNIETINIAYKALISKEIPREIYEKIIEIDSLNTSIFSSRSQFIQSNLDHHFNEEISKITIAKLKAENDKKGIQLEFYIYTIILLSLVVFLIILMVAYIVKGQRYKLLAKEKLTRLAEEKLQLEKERVNRLESEQQKVKLKLQKKANQIEKQKGILSRFESILSEVKKAENQTEGVRVLQNFNAELKEFVGGIFEDEIKLDFKELNPKKFEKLKERLDDDSSSEFLLAILLLQDFNTKDVATSLNKSEKAIRSIRYRLRKALNINQEINLIDFLKSL